MYDSFEICFVCISIAFSFPLTHNFSYIAYIKALRCGARATSVASVELQVSTYKENERQSCVARTSHRGDIGRVQCSMEPPYNHGNRLTTVTYEFPFIAQREHSITFRVRSGTMETRYRFVSSYFIPGAASPSFRASRKRRPELVTNFFTKATLWAARSRFRGKVNFEEILLKRPLSRLAI